MPRAPAIAGLAAAALAAGATTRPADLYDAGEIYCCGGRDVWLLNVEQARADPTRRVWSWRAGDSPQIRPEHRAWFGAMDECKPVMGGRAVLVSSSSAGGVALIRRRDKACLFYCGGRNAHSAELIGDDLVAGAFSFRSDHLRLYRLGGEALPARRDWLMKLPGAHGVVWDRAREVLWALGSAELLKLKVNRPEPGDEKASAEVLKRWKLPRPGGHDLFPLDDRRLAVTVGRGVYTFDAATEAFAPMKELAGKAAVKSVCRHPRTGRIAYVQGDPTFAGRISFVGAEPLGLDGRKDLYKARWNMPNAFSHGR